MPRPAPATVLGDQRPTPKPDAAFVPLWQGRGKEQHTFLLLNDAVYGIDTHWNGHRIIPCTLALGACDPCSAKWQRRWRGFIGGASCRTKGRYLLQITPLAWRECDELPELDFKLRGRQFNVRRLNDKPQAPWKWSYAHFPQVEPPFQRMDVVGVLSRMWGIDLMALGNLKDFKGDVRPYLRPWNRKGEQS